MPQETIARFRNSLGTITVVQREDAEKHYGKNEIAAKRKILLALKPKRFDEVRDIVRTALKYKIKLYPVSMGNNWGYGASTPVVDDCVVVDLSGLNRIIEFDGDLGLVTLEPGVTPLQLREYLDKNNYPFLVPVSGAGPFSSLIGNALERGYGVTPYVDHFGAVTSIEAILPNGEVYRSALTEMGGEAVDKAFKWGLGPYIDGIFSQGNFGIVTKMTIALSPIPQAVEMFLLGVSDERKLEGVCAIRNILKKTGNTIGSINLMNSRRVLAMIEEYPFEKVEKNGILSAETVARLARKNYLSDWTIGGVIYGDKRVVRAAKATIGKEVRPFAKRLMFFSRKKIDLVKGILNFLPVGIGKNMKKQLENLDEAFKVAEGAPSEIALPLCYWKSGKKPPKDTMMNPAHDDCGVIWYSPLVPMKPQAVGEYSAMIERVCASKGIEPLITLTSLSYRCFDSTVPILFDPKNEDETKRAKECYELLFKEGRKRGFIPYRISIDNMKLVTASAATYWNLVKRLKETIDPEHIFAPGRYCPREPR